MFIRSRSSSRGAITPGSTHRSRAGCRRARAASRLVAGALAAVLLLAPCGRAFAETESDRRIRQLEDALRKTQQQLDSIAAQS